MGKLIELFSKLFSKKKSNSTLSLYRDYVIAIDLQNQEDPQIRFCWIKEVNENEVTVSIPALKLDSTVIVWIPERNNFFFKDQMDIVNNFDFKSLKNHNFPKAVSQG